MARPMKIEISEQLLPVLRLGVLRMEDMSLPADGGDALWQEVSNTCERLGSKYGGLTAGQIPEVQETRRLYRKVGLDPTKTRPSSEALLRRIIKGKGLYRIHPLVDSFNLTSVVCQLSVGLYDESRIAGDRVAVGIGQEGWGFEGIRKGRINVAGRLCLTDSDSPFGSPTADSARTSIEGSVERALAVFFQPLDGDIVRLEEALDMSTNLVTRHLDARVHSQEIIG